MSADIDTLKQDGVLHTRVAVHANEGSQDAPFDAASGNYRPLADDAVQSASLSIDMSEAAEHELRRRQDRLVGANGPSGIVHIQQRVDGHQVHIGFEVRVQRTHIAPIGILFSVFITKRKRVDAMRVDDGRNDVPAEIMRTVRVGRVSAELFEQKSSGEHVDAHRRQAMLAVARDRLGIIRLLFKTNDPIVLVDLHDAKIASRRRLDAQGADGQVGLRPLVVLDHGAVVHLIDVVARQNDHVTRTLFLQRVDILIDGVGRSLVPMFVDTLLRWHDVDELVQFATEEAPPAKIDVPIQAHRLVLGQHEHLANAAIEAVGE